MKKLLIGLAILVLIMAGFIWKSNRDRDARQELLAIQTEQHNKKMAQLDAEQQARIKQEENEKEKEKQQRDEYNNQVKLEAEKYKSTQIEQEKVAEKNNSIEEKARKNLFDPSAAQFRNIQGNCGEINAKNKMGGYTGFRRFIYDPKFDSVAIEDESDGLYNAKMMDILWQQKCS